MDHFQGSVVDALNLQDQRNQDLLDQVITAANEVSDDDAVADVVMDGDPNTTHEAGAIRWGGKEASIQGTGGVALLEFAKDAIQTAVSNISGIGTLNIALRKAAERKMNAQ